MTEPTHRNLVPADDGQLHTEECVAYGWWLLDWEADCRFLGVPPGGQRAAHAERALFSTAVIVLQLLAMLFTLTARRRR